MLGFMFTLLVTNTLLAIVFILHLQQYINKLLKRIDGLEKENEMCRARIPYDEMTPHYLK